jgi:hypothetical protein
VKILSKTSQSSQQNIKTKMEDTTMAEKQKLMYQWIKSERFGDVVTVAEDQKDGKWLYFEDGTRINPALVQEYLMKVESEDKILKVSTNDTSLQTGPIQDQTNVVSTNTSDAVITQGPTIPELSVMGKMIMKMSKKNVVNVPIQINVNIPTPALYTMLSEGMEEEDLNEEIMEVALQQIEINNLTEYLKENISSFLSEYYSN